MKKIINSTETLVEDALRGYTMAHGDIIRLVPGTHMVERVRPKEAGKVRMLMGNGAGHEPAVACWVGLGMFDLNVVGEIFTCASSAHIYEGIRRLSAGGPVLVAVQNHAGDVLNADMAVARAQAEGIDVQSVLFYDDIASAPRDMIEERRGIGGMLFYAKIVGALAERGASLAECAAMFERVRETTRTYAVAVTNCTHPITGMAMFAGLPDDRIELGMGVHGEGGGGQIPLPTARELARLLCKTLAEDGGYSAGDRLLLMVNGAGGMTMMELSILYGELADAFAARGLEIAGCKVGSYLTTQELSGVSVSSCAVDGEMLALWNEPCRVGQF